MIKVRTINGAYESIKAADPGTAITLRAIRRAVSEGDIPSRRVGNGKQRKYLVDLEQVLAYFSGQEVE